MGMEGSCVECPVLPLALPVSPWPLAGQLQANPVLTQTQTVTDTHANAERHKAAKTYSRCFTKCLSIIHMRQSNLDKKQHIMVNISEDRTRMELNTWVENGQWQVKQGANGFVNKEIEPLTKTYWTTWGKKPFYVEVDIFTKRGWTLLKRRGVPWNTVVRLVTEAAM